MSIDQPDLSTFVSDDEDVALHRQTLESRGAAYTPSTTATSADDKRAPSQACLNCGADIDSQTARVVGDNNGCVPGCVECREEVLSAESVVRGHFLNTPAIVRKLRTDEHGHTLDNTAGGRR